MDDLSLNENAEGYRPFVQTSPGRNKTSAEVRTDSRKLVGFLIVTDYFESVILYVRQEVSLVPILKRVFVEIVVRTRRTKLSQNQNPV